MTKETTWQRYKRVLKEIADGAGNPQELATEALQSHKPVPSDRESTRAARAKSAQEKRDARLKYGQELYMQWLRDGHPQMTKFAKKIGISRGQMDTLLGYADKELPASERRLMHSYRTKDYKTAAEVRRMHAIRDMAWENSDIPYYNNYPEFWYVNDAFEKAVNLIYEPGLSNETIANSVVRYIKKYYPSFKLLKAPRREETNADAAPGNV